MSTSIIFGNTEFTVYDVSGVPQVAIMAFTQSEADSSYTTFYGYRDLTDERDGVGNESLVMDKTITTPGGMLNKYLEDKATKKLNKVISPKEWRANNQVPNNQWGNA